MMPEQSVSAFAQLIDGLKNKSEAELKSLYLNFLSQDLKEEWYSITQQSDFDNATDEEIVQAIHKQRYQSS